MHDFSEITRAFLFRRTLPFFNTDIRKIVFLMIFSVKAESLTGDERGNIFHGVCRSFFELRLIFLK